MSAWILLSTIAVVCALAFLPRIGRLFYKPLRIGDRVRISGAHEEPAPWLQDRREVQGEVTAAVTSHQRDAYEVMLDSPLVKGSICYRFALLQLRFADARWAQHEIVGVELWEDAPSRGVVGGTEAHHEYVESHAIYRVIGSASLG